MDDQPIYDVPGDPQPEGMPDQGFAQEVHGQTVNFGPGFALQARADGDLTVAQGGAAAIAVQGDAEINYGGALALAVGKDCEVAYGGSAILSVGRDLTLTNGGGALLSVGHDAILTNGAAETIIAGQVQANRSFLGIVLAREVAVAEDSKVLLNTRQAAVFGAVAGVFFALVSWLLRKKD